MALKLPLDDAARIPLSWHGVGAVLERGVRLARTDSFPGTVLLTGEEGLGREAVAVELAAALVCRDPGAPHPSGCRCCERVRRGVHPDIDLLDVAEGKTAIAIEQARALVDTLPHLPFEGKRRVAIIASAHTPPLGSDVASALLKTLEEPPSHAVIILLAANSLRVLPTIVSRSVRLLVPAPRQDEAASLLRASGTLEGDGASVLLERLAGDAVLALRCGKTPPAELGALAEGLAAALAGDGLAMARVPGLIDALGGDVEPAVGLLLAGAVAGGEASVAAAAALLRADRRRRALNLDGDTTLAGAMASVAIERAGGD